MVVVARDLRSKIEMLGFLADRGVRLCLSEDVQCIGRRSENDHALIGVVAFNGFTGAICQMHVAGDGNWITRELIRASFDYPFRQLGLASVIAPVAGNNKRALKMDKHFGFTEVYRIRDGYERHVDLVLLQMDRDDCRWIAHDAEILAAA